MNQDLSSILDEWPYEGEQTVRIIEAGDGRPLLQVRLLLGIEQYEMDGRPDGSPAGVDPTFLDTLEYRLKEEGPEKFSLGHEDFLRLQAESVMFYYRYILLFQLGDYSRTIRDTDHNLRACELVERFGEEEADRSNFLQYKPYIIRVNSVARAMLLMEQKDFAEARDILRRALADIAEIKDVDTVVFKIEKVRSLKQMKAFLSQLESKEMDPLTALKIELKRAVEEEDYEHAAEVRDMIAERSRRDSENTP